MQGLLYGGAGSARDSANLYLPLVTTLQLTGGTGAATITRATVGTFTDFEGLQKTARAGEIRETGARRVENLWGIQSATLAIAAANTMTLAAGTYVFSMGAGTGTVTFSGTGGATGTLTANATNRTSVSKTITAGTLIVTGSVAILVDLQVELTTGQANQNPSEYVSNGVLAAPYHGAGVDGVKYFSTLNGNTVSSNVVTEATGAAIAATTTLGLLCEPAATNIVLQSNNFGTTWTTTLTTLVQNAVDPAGKANSAWTLTDSNAAAFLNIAQAITIPADASTYTVVFVVAKTAAGTAPVFGSNFGLSGGTAVNVNTRLDTDTGIVRGSGASVLLNGFWYLSIPIINNGTNTTLTITIYPAAQVNGGISDVAAAVGSNVLSDVMVAVTPYRTSIIGTAATAVTRNADVLSIPTASNIRTTGSVYFEFTPTHTPSGSVYFFGSYTDANGHVQIYHDATSMRMHKSVAGVAYDATITNAFVAGTTYKVAGRFGTAGQQIAINGVLGTANTDVSAAVIAATIQIGADGAGTGQPTASIKNVYTYATALSDANLIEITQ